MFGMSEIGSSWAFNGSSSTKWQCGAENAGKELNVRGTNRRQGCI